MNDFSKIIDQLQQKQGWKDETVWAIIRDYMDAFPNLYVNKITTFLEELAEEENNSQKETF